jgi:hypothetical protein
MLGNQGCTQIHDIITELLIAFIAKNSKNNGKHMDSKIINVPEYKTCKTK